MAQVFISYSHVDAERARAIASAIEAYGWSVWWDPEIRSGESFVSLINREISQASCVVVLWSRTSVGSRWVLEEAHNGLNRDILCPVLIDRDVQLPVGFATIKYTPLSDWRNGHPVGGFHRLMGEVERLIGAPTRVSEQAPAVPRAETPRPAMPPNGPEPSQPPTPPIVASHPRPQTADPPIGTRAPAAPASIDRFIDFSDTRWFDWPVVALLGAAVVIMLLTIVARQLFSMPLPWDEIAVIAVAIAGLFGAAIAERNGRHVQSPVFALLFRGGATRLLAPLHGLVGAGVFAFTAYAVVTLARQSFESGERSVSLLSLPLGPIKLLIAAALFYLALVAALSAVRALTRRSGQ